MRVVLDASVVISFLLTHGQTISKVLENWKIGKFTLFISDEILVELKQTLFRLYEADLISVDEANALLNQIEKDAEFITVSTVVDISIDKKDNRYLACAKDGKADYLVTGDKKHLLPLRKFGKTKIISPKKFVDILGQ